MKKRILSILLACVMLVTLLPIPAHADDDGAECLNCGHYHYGDYMCKCGLCSIDCSNSDCWKETHCQNCGECYMDVHTWCDDCGWCENCMKDDNSHCEDCGRCFVGDDRSELCEDCGKCSDCVGEICDECNKCDDCAGDDHCRDCPAHLEDDDVCGYCEECALAHRLHCEECGGCFEDSAEPCPVHPGETHCAECAGFICERCSRCEYEDGIEPCPDCELCTECCEEISMSNGCSTGEVCVESSDWDDHICEECGECFCEKERCDYCGLCEDCCIENSEAAGCYCSNNVCVEDPDWASHFESCHGDGEIPADHKHRYNENEWTVNENFHWHACRLCGAIDDKSYGEHRLTAAGKCEDCGFDTNSPLFFISQPNDLTRRVTDGNAEDPDDPNGSLKNRAVFSVSAMNLAGEELEFQWYMGSKALVDEEGYISGSTTNVLNVAVPSDGCGNEYEYYCVVKSKDASGNPISIESSHAALRIVHNHGPLKRVEPKNGWHMTVINYTDDEGGKHENVYYSTGSTEHNSFCYGSDCNHTKFKTGSNHSFVYDRYLGAGHFASESESAPVKYFYITKCSECGYENLLYTEENTELIYNISIIDTPGAYAMNDDDVEGVTKAKTGEHIAVIAPYANKAGNVFDHWEVVSAPDGFTNASIENYFGVGSFNMPAGSIVLRCVYSTDKVLVKEVQIKGKSPAIDEKGYITVEVGKTFTVTSIISPDNVADKRVKWAVDSVGIIKFTDEYSASDAGIVSKDIEGDVSLVALKPGIVRLRAFSTESNNTSSNTPIQDSVYVKVVPAKGETHNYEIAEKHYKTCTENGYILYKCTDEGCNKSYKGNIEAAIGHNDSDGDGYCNNIDENTGKVCGKKLTEPEKRYSIHVENGRASDSEGKTVVFAKTGDVITVTAKAAPAGQKFIGWAVAEGGVTLADATSSVTTFTMGDKDVKISVVYHTHSVVSDKWLHDGVTHWNPCADDTCSDRFNEASHTFAWVIDKMPTTETSGLKHEECTVCGERRSENTYIGKISVWNIGGNTGANSKPNETNPNTGAIVTKNAADSDKALLLMALSVVSGSGILGLCALNGKKKRTQ